MNEIDKIEIPEDKVERFWVLVLMFAQEMGIEDHKDVYHNVELLGKSVERHIVERNLPISPQKKVSRSRATFIAIFKKRYLQLTDCEYTRIITAAEGKLINQINKSLRERDFDCNDYLRWLFEDFLPDNKRLCPPSIKQICARFYVDKFFFEYKDEAKERKTTKLKQSESEDLANRCRALVRGPAQKIKDEIRKVVSDYKDGKIFLEDLRKKVETWEGEYK